MKRFWGGHDRAGRRAGDGREIAHLLLALIKLAHARPVLIHARKVGRLVPAGRCIVPRVRIEVIIRKVLGVLPVGRALVIIRPAARVGWSIHRHLWVRKGTASCKGRT